MIRFLLNSKTLKSNRVKIEDTEITIRFIPIRKEFKMKSINNYDTGNNEKRNLFSLILA